MLRSQGFANWLSLQRATFARYGEGRQPNRHIDHWEWLTDGIFMILEYDSGKAELFLFFNPIANEKDADRAARAKNAAATDF
jgi:hypothetical protein